MKKIIVITTISLVLVILGCTKDFISKDIKNQVLTIVAPNDSLKTPSNVITFWWDELDGAEKYNIQIVKPSFNTIQQLLVDSNITTNKFNYTLSPGKYQWRVRATNNNGSTAYITRTLIIDSTSNLSLVSVALVAPINNAITKNKTINFQWNSVISATNYELEIKDNNGGIIANPTGIIGTSFSYSFTNTVDANFSWKVKAINAFGSTINNASRTFTIDVTAPIASNLTYPSYGYLNTSAINDSLKWNRTITNALFDTKYDSIIISTDSNFISPPYVSRGKTYGTKLKITSLSPQLPYPSLPGNNFYWLKIISVDSVRNISTASSKIKFKLQ